MTQDPAYAAQLPAAGPGAYDYDAFLSYSRADTPVAEGIQKGLHTIGRKLGRLHALRVFRDKTDLAASPSLWAKLTEALDKSRYLVVVLSPNSASSEWVNKEIDYWLTHRGRDNLVLVMADGTLIWDDTHGRFDPDNSTASPPALEVIDALGTEPVYIDVSHDNPWDIQNPVFRDKLTDIAAPIHGKPKYELASEDLREQQRFRRFRRLAITGLALLLVISISAASVAFIQRREAIAQRNEAIHQRNSGVARGLVSDAEAILRGVRGGGDDRAVQELTTAFRLSPTTAQGGLLGGWQETSTMAKIIRTPDVLSRVIITPDGKRIVSASFFEPTIKVWDAATGRLLSALKGHTEGVYSIALSADGSRLVSGGNDRTARVWDLRTGQPIGGPLTGLHQISAVAISPDGSRIAAGSELSTIQIWDVNTGKLVGQPLLAHTDMVYGLAFSPDGRRLVSGGNSTVRVWDSDTGQPIGEPTSVGDAFVFSIALRPDGRVLALGIGARVNDTPVNEVQLRDAVTLEPIGTPFTGHTDRINQVAFSPDGKRIASGSTDRSVRVWDADTHMPIGKPYLGHDGDVQSVAFTPDGSQVVSGSADHTIRRWTVGTDGTQRMHIADDDQNIAFSNDGSLIVSSGKDGRIRMWDTRSRQPVWQMQEPNPNKNLAPQVIINSDSRRIALIDSSAQIEIWHTATNTRLTTIKTQKPAVKYGEPYDYGARRIAFSPDGHRVAAATYKNVVRVWDADNGQQIGPDLLGAKIGYGSVMFSADGARAIAYGETGIWMWDIASGTPVGIALATDIGPIDGVAISRDGRIIASGSQDSRLGGDYKVRLWDTDSGKPIGAPLTGHTQLIRSIGFSVDGTLLASGMRDVRIWDVATGQQLGIPLDPIDDIDLVAFTSDGREILAASRSRGTFWVRWPGPAQWPDLLCDKLTSNMSRTQWKLWVSPDIEYVPGCPSLPVPE
ncbi:TIR domain-containing protein [Mycobacteroides chelonae]|uniref:TIR domain-containing protein n=1 Tax=Mycobacteroides chelonae TaxID=1774 RepID=UPI003AB0CA38